MPPTELPITINWLQIGAQFGFNAVLVVLLLVFGRGLLLQGFATIDRLARAVALVVLAMSFAPKEFHKQSEEIIRDIDAK